MITAHRGYLVSMYNGTGPTTPNTSSLLFGPVLSSDLKFSSENICSNRLRTFQDKRETLIAAAERERSWKKQNFKTRVVEAEIQITENPDDWEKLRDFGSYVAAVGEDLSDLALYGSARGPDGKRVDVAHDYWAPIHANGLSTFKDFKVVTGETSLGVISELARQSQTRVRLVGLLLKW